MQSETKLTSSEATLCSFVLGRTYVSYRNRPLLLSHCSPVKRHPSREYTLEVCLHMLNCLHDACADYSSLSRGCLSLSSPAPPWLLGPLSPKTSGAAKTRVARKRTPMMTKAKIHWNAMILIPSW